MQTCPRGPHPAPSPALTTRSARLLARCGCRRMGKHEHNVCQAHHLPGEQPRRSHLHWQAGFGGRAAATCSQSEPGPKFPAPCSSPGYFSRRFLWGRGAQQTPGFAPEMKVHPSLALGWAPCPAEGSDPSSQPTSTGLYWYLSSPCLGIYTLDLESPCQGCRLGTCRASGKNEEKQQPRRHSHAPARRNLRWKDATCRHLPGEARSQLCLCTALHARTGLPRWCRQRASPGAAGTQRRGRRFRYNQSNCHARSPPATRTSATWKPA